MHSEVKQGMLEQATRITGVASPSFANVDINNYLGPIMASLIGLAGLVSAFFLITAGIEYMTSSGKPDRLEHAKRVMRNALVGLILVIAAGTLASILSGAYGDAGGSGLGNMPSLTPVEASSEGGGITEILLKAIIGLFQHIIETAGAPFIAALGYFTEATPLAGDNPSVFRLWLVVAGIANSLFVVVVALLGFQMMSAATIGFEELEFKKLLPKLAAVFLLMNSSLFLIDVIIGLSNVMITAVVNAFSALTVWEALSGVVDEAGGQGLVALMIMVVFITLAVILLVYYVMRIVTIYVGAILSPLVALLSIVPGFRDFTMTAMKAYLMTVFVLFVHVIILTLSSSLFDGLGRDDGAYDPVMAMIIGVASLVALLKTQGVMMQMSYVSVGPKALRKLGGQFMNGVHYTTGRARSLKYSKGIKKGYK
jgi:hypothetical protein